MTTGERIKARRKQLSISADVLAERLNVSRSTVFRWEKGEVEKIPAVEMNTIARALQTTSEYLIGITDDPDKEFTDTESIVHLQTDEARILAKGFDRMPEAERKRAVDMAKLIFAAYADLFKEGNDET